MGIRAGQACPNGSVIHSSSLNKEICFLKHVLESRHFWRKTALVSLRVPAADPALFFLFTQTILRTKLCV